jgi:transcriptional regulator with XRE-family HTH domain
MENKEKTNIKLKFSLCLQSILRHNKSLAHDAELSGKKDANAITSLRKLAASSGVEFSIIQKISSGKRNPALSTIVAIAEGLNISLSELFFSYDKISEEEIKSHQTTSQKSKKGNKKKK